MTDVKTTSINVPRITIPKTLSYAVAFLLLEFACMQAHEVVHHVVGRLVCGAWGDMTFNLFNLSPGCFETKKVALISTFAGPALSYFLMWAGMLLVLKNRHGLLGISLIFANLPFARFITAVMAGGDEMMIGRRIIGASAYPVILCSVTLIILPPLVVALKSIANKRRRMIFVAFLLLTLAYDALTKRILLAPLVERWEMFASEVCGIPLFIICVDAVVLIALVWCGQYLFARGKSSAVAVFAVSK